MTLLEKIAALIVYTCAVLAIGIMIGWHIGKPVVDQNKLNNETKIGKQYADKRDADKEKGDEQTGKAASSSTKVVYKNCSLDDEDFTNLTEAFKR